MNPANYNIRDLFLKSSWVYMHVSRPYGNGGGAVGGCGGRGLRGTAGSVVARLAVDCVRV